MLALAELLAGLGLLFIGLKLLSSHLQQAMGRRVRTLLKAATRSRLVGLSCGALAGAIVQSSNAVTLIAGNLVRGGVLTTREAIPVVAGANVGTSALVFVASIDLKVAVFYLVALVGIAYQFRLDRTPERREWLGVLLGLALLFLGLSFIKLAPQDVPPEIMAALLAGVTPFMGFAIGFIVATLTQSASTATILCLASIGTGAIDLSDSVFIVLGANVGSGVATLVSAGPLKGTGKQLCYAHILVKLAGSAIVAAAGVALWASPAAAAALLARLGTAEPAFVISVLFLVLQVSGAAVVTLFAGASERLARRFSPPSREDHVSQPRFISAPAMADPPSALDLAAREIDRLIARLPRLTPDLDPSGSNDPRERAVQWTGSRAIADATGHFLVELIDRHLSRADLDLALLIQERQRLLVALQDTLKEFAALADGYQTPPPLVFNLAESLRMLTLEVADLPGGTLEDIELVLALTADRSGTLDRIRRSLTAEALGTGETARRLLVALSLFERAVWLMNRLASTLRESANADNRT